MNTCPLPTPCRSSCDAIGTCRAAELLCIARDAAPYCIAVPGFEVELAALVAAGEMERLAATVGRVAR